MNKFLEAEFAKLFWKVQDFIVRVLFAFKIVMVFDSEA